MLATFRTFWRNQPIVLALALVAAFGSAGGAISVAAHPEARAHDAVWAYRDAHPGEAVPVIVQTSAPNDPDELVRAAGGQVRDDLGLIHGVSASVPAGALNELASADGVTWISLDSPVTSTGGDDSTTTQDHQRIQRGDSGRSRRRVRQLRPGRRRRRRRHRYLRGPGLQAERQLSRYRNILQGRHGRRRRLRARLTCGRPGRRRRRAVGRQVRRASRRRRT